MKFLARSFFWLARRVRIGRERSIHAAILLAALAGMYDCFGFGGCVQMIQLLRQEMKQHGRREGNKKANRVVPGL